MTTNVNNQNDTSECKIFKDLNGKYKIKRNGENTGADEKGEYIVRKESRILQKMKEKLRIDYFAWIFLEWRALHLFKLLEIR